MNEYVINQQEFICMIMSHGIILQIEKPKGNKNIKLIKGIQQYIFLLFHLEELLKLYVNLFYRFCVTLLFLEIFEQKKSQIS